MFNDDGSIKLHCDCVDEVKENKRPVGRPKLSGKLQKEIVKAIAIRGSATYTDLIEATGRSQQGVSSAVIRLESLKVLRRRTKIVDYGIESIKPQRLSVFTLRAI